MRAAAVLLAVAALPVLASPPARADAALLLRGLVGFSVIGEERVEGFAGCQYGGLIRFRSGAYVWCRDYRRQDPVDAGVAILAAPAAGPEDWAFPCRMVVGDVAYAVGCAEYARDRAPSFREPAAPPPDEVRRRHEERLELLEGLRAHFRRPPPAGRDFR